MMASIILGGITIPNAKAFDRTDIFVGKQERAHDGTLLTDYTARLSKWDIEAALLTESQRDTVKNLTTVTTAQTFTDVDGANYSVVVMQNSYREKRLPVSNSSIRYDVSFSIEESA